MINKKNILLAAVIFPAVMAFGQQYGGMWIPTELNEKEMHAYQCYVFLAALQIAILEAINPNLKTI